MRTATLRTPIETSRDLNAPIAHNPSNRSATSRLRGYASSRVVVRQQHSSNTGRQPSALIGLNFGGAVSPLIAYLQSSGSAWRFTVLVFSSWHFGWTLARPIFLVVFAPILRSFIRWSCSSGVSHRHGDRWVSFPWLSADGSTHYLSLLLSWTGQSFSSDWLRS